MTPTARLSLRTVIALARRRSYVWLAPAALVAAAVVALPSQAGASITHFHPRPTAANTGVPAGTHLRHVYHDVVVTKPGTVLNGLDIHGFVVVKADNVTIENSVIRGRADHGDRGLIENFFGAKNLRIAHCDLVPTHPFVGLDGVKGWNYTLRWSDIRGTVDGAKVFGDNVAIRYNYIHNLHHYAHDPDQHNGPSHNDGIQVLGGRNVRIAWNTITAPAENSALQVTQGYGSTSGLRFRYNWLGGGACTVNVAIAPRSAMTRVIITGNRFWRTSQFHCPMIIDRSVTGLITDNRYLDDQASANVVRRPA